MPCYRPGLIYRVNRSPLGERRVASMFGLLGTKAATSTCLCARVCVYTRILSPPLEMKCPEERDCWAKGEARLTSVAARRFSNVDAALASPAAAVPGSLSLWPVLIFSVLAAGLAVTVVSPTADSAEGSSAHSWSFVSLPLRTACSEAFAHF